METEILDTATDWLTNNQGLIIEYAVNLSAALLTLVIGYIAAGLLSGGLTRLLTARKVDKTITGFVGNLVRYAILAFVIIAALSRIGVQTASFVAIIGAAGLAVGLALQGSLANFAAGVLLIAFRPIRAGEYVEVAGTAGTVQTVQIFTTVLTTPDNKMVVVPNGNVLNGNVVNYSRMPTRRVDMTFGIGYGADLLLAKQILTRLVQADARILTEPGYTLAVGALADSSVNLVLRTWVNSGDYWPVFFDMQEQVKLAFDAEGIEIPFPQLSVHLPGSPA